MHLNEERGNEKVPSPVAGQDARRHRFEMRPIGRIVNAQIQFVQTTRETGKPRDPAGCGIEIGSKCSFKLAHEIGYRA